MKTGDGKPSLRRSTRQRKEISYNSLGKLPDSPSPEPTEEPDSEFVEKPTWRRARGRPRHDGENTYVAVKSDQLRHGRIEDRLTAVAGTDADTQATLAKRMDKWKNILSEVPEELLNYSIGWGSCAGEWGDKGGERQKLKLLEAKLMPPGNCVKKVEMWTNT
jgi:hypothetical protein